MSDRIKPKETLQDPDVPLIGSFAGLSSASLNSTGEVVYSDKLVNCVVTKSGEVRKRNGSNVESFITWFTKAKGAEVYGFQFDGIDYKLVRTGMQLSLYTIGQKNNAYYYAAFKNNVFRLQSNNEKATYAHIIDGDNCFVLIATPSTQLIGFVITGRTTNIDTKPTNWEINYKIPGYPLNNNIITNSNTLVFSLENDVHTASSVTQTGGDIKFIANNSLTWASVGTTIKHHSYFWVRFADANYYPGLYLYQSALRRNSVALDVNVQVPAELYDNPIYNEPQIQNTGRATVYVYKNNDTTAAGAYDFQINNKPTTENQWSFSDGSFTPIANLYTRPTPAYIAFGALQPGGVANRVFINRSRVILVAGGSGVQTQYLNQFVNKVPYAYPSYTDDLFTQWRMLPTEIAQLFGMHGYDPVALTHKYPGVDLSAVVEIIYNIASSAGTAAQLIFADLQPSGNGSINIGDGFILPLYGYNAIANTKDNRYPNIVAVVGNRIVLTGLSNQVAISHADWTFRGVSFNNLQASTIDFSSSSAYYIRPTQGSSKVNAITSVNGVLIIATDVGVFRVSGSSATSPPTADNANIARISNELIPTNTCFSVFENKVFYASRNGFYQLVYQQDMDELGNASMSSQVSNFFTDYVPQTVTYSNKLRAFLIQFAGVREMLMLSLDSETWSTIKISTGLLPELNQSFDGYTLKTVDAALDDNMFLANWSDDTTDCANLGAYVGYTMVVPGTSVTIQNYPTDVSLLATPAESIATLNSQCVHAPGKNHAMVLGANSAVVVEHPGGLTPMPIIASMVTKGFVSDKLNRAHRIRSCNLLLKGSGVLKARLVLPTQSYSDRYNTFETYLVNTTTQYQGEGMLNAAYGVRLAPGNSINLRFPMVGISEMWQLACVIDNGLTIAGLQFDTSRKSMRRLR